MKKITRLAVLFSAILSLNFLSCKMDLVSEPTIDINEKKSMADYSDNILPPAIVTATHGGYRQITVSWQPVENAIDYIILAADSPFDTFTKIAETNQTSYTISEEPGISRYFAVSAVNFYGTVSAKSIITLGTSMATPIITSITENNTATAFDVNWWMDNCNTQTYQNNIQFTVKVYDSKKRIIDSFSKTVSGKERNIQIEGLTSSTEYNFQVEAELLKSNQKKEISDMTTAESAHKVTPNAPSDFSVTKGVSRNTTLSWKLPDATWYKNKIYQLNPVYFKVYRKANTETEYKLLTTIGVEPNAGWGEYVSTAEYYFNCETGSVFKADEKYLNSEDRTVLDYISITKNSGASKMDSPFEAYTPGSIIEFTDTTISRGIKYDYYIRSYTDCVPASKAMTDETSVTSVVSGWSISQPELNIHQENTYLDETTISSSKAVLSNSVFNNNSLNYTYLLTKTEVDANDEQKDDSVPVILKQTNSFDEIKSFTDTITATNDAQYFLYKLYILEKTDSVISTIPSSPSEYIECATGSTTLTVINDPSQLPVIEEFTVEDGYKDKFVIHWKKVPGASYKIISTKYNNGLLVENSASSVDLTNSTPGVTESNDILTYNLAATSGDSNKFVLKITKGTIKVEKALDNIYQTLGTPEIAFTEYDYDSITVSWPEVQMASTDDETTEQKLSKYTVTAAYNSSPATELITAENTTITYDETTKQYICKINQPEGYDISTKSGLPITLKVKVTNTKDNTTGTKEVRTLGPAEIQYDKDYLPTDDNTYRPKKNYTTITWTPAIGADKYLVYRIMFSNFEKTEIMGTDKLIIDTKKLTVEDTNSQDTSNRTTVSYDENENKYTLEDRQYDSDETYGYQFNQERIQWGYPIGYVVLPLRQKDNASTYSFDEKSFASDSKVKYTDDFITREMKYRYTFGYGFNVHAAKSESGSKIHLTWEKPNDIVKSVSIYRMPFNKTKDYNYGSTWEYIKTLDSDDTEYYDVIKDSSIAHKAYVYAVQYDATSDLVRSYRTSDQALGMKDKNYNDKYTAANKAIEPSNKGYLFSITDVKAQPIDGINSYKELITWNSTWDFEERALCPKGFDIQIKNKNLAYTKDWISVAKVNISPKGDFTFDKTFAFPSGNTYDVSVNTDAIGEMSIQPESFINNTSPIETNGLLKVLRDTRHYYSLNITDGTKYDRQFEDESLYTYRNITDTELVKCVNLIIADALYQTSIPTVKTGDLFTKNWGNNYLEGYKGNGKLTISHYGGVGSGDLCRWSLGTNYVHQFLSGGPADTDNPIISNFTLSSTTSNGETGIKDYKLFHLPELSITVNQFNEDISLNSLKNRIIKISIGEKGTSQKYTLKITVDDSNSFFVNINNDFDTFMTWFPYWLNNSLSESPITSYNSSCPLYMVPQESDDDDTKAWKTWWN